VCQLTPTLSLALTPEPMLQTFEVILIQANFIVEPAHLASGIIPDFLQVTALISQTHQFGNQGVELFWGCSAIFSLAAPGILNADLLIQLVDGQDVILDGLLGIRKSLLQPGQASS
jgi:hypothetical protein